MSRKPIAIALSLIILAVIIPGNDVFAGQNTIKFYGKGTIDETSVSPQVMLRTLIDSDTATFLRTGAGGINVVRMSLGPSDVCTQSKDTMCFAGIVTQSNTEMHQTGDKISITLDLANKKEIVTFDSGKIQGTTFNITLSKAQIRLDGPYQIALTQEGGFAGIQKTTTIDTELGQLTLDDSIMPLDDQSVKQLIKAIKKARFFDLTETNYPPVQGSADYFSYSLQISQGVFSKTVTWTDTSQSVPEKLFSILDVVQGLSTVPSLDDDGKGAIEIKLARDFAATTPTFAFDGMEDTLDVVDIKILESFPEQYHITLEFTSTHGGYGDRTDQIVTEALTPHTLEITIVQGEVLSAITDGTWDEMNNQYILKAPESE